MSISTSIIKQDSRSSSFPRLRTNYCPSNPGDNGAAELGGRTYTEYTLCTKHSAGRGLHISSSYFSVYSRWVFKEWNNCKNLSYMDHTLQFAKQVGTYQPICSKQTWERGRAMILIPISQIREMKAEGSYFSRVAHLIIGRSSDIPTRCLFMNSQTS